MKKRAALRITKEFHFEMAHALYGYDGPCKNIHGHSYTLSVTVKGKIITDKKNPKLGMVMDFSDLKKIINKKIIEKFDHSLVLNKNTPHKVLNKKNLPVGKIIMTKYQPTCENLLVDFSNILLHSLPRTVKLHNLKLRETHGSYAEWHIKDNL